MLGDVLLGVTAAGRLGVSHGFVVLTETLAAGAGVVTEALAVGAGVVP